MTSRAPGTLETLDVVAKLAGAILIPVVLFALGTRHTEQIRAAQNAQLRSDRAIEQARHNLDRVAIILRHLASERVAERQLAVHFVEYLNNNGQFPTALYPVLLTALADEDEAVRESVTAVLDDLETRHPELRADPRLIFSPPAEADAGARIPVRLHPRAQSLYDRGLGDR